MGFTKDDNFVSGKDVAVVIRKLAAVHIGQTINNTIAK